jgi:hypothetical protein
VGVGAAVRVSQYGTALRTKRWKARRQLSAAQARFSREWSSGAGVGMGLARMRGEKRRGIARNSLESILED